MEMNTKCPNSPLFNFQNSKSFQYYHGDLEAVIPPIRALALPLLALTPLTTEILIDFWPCKKAAFKLLYPLLSPSQCHQSKNLLFCNTLKYYFCFKNNFEQFFNFVVCLFKS